MGCGCGRIDVEDRRVPLVCADNDHKTYLLARHKNQAFYQEVAKYWGIEDPETRH
jgi:hypothetical protein